MEQKNWKLNEKQHEFKMRRAQIRKEYDDEVRQLQTELSAKVARLQMERDRKLEAVNIEDARYHDAYRQWKHENMMQPVTEEKQ